MSDALLGSLISGVVALAVALITNQTARKKDAIANAVRDQKIEDSLNELSKRVDEHNGIMDKVTNMSADVKTLRVDVEWLKKEHQK